MKVVTDTMTQVIDALLDAGDILEDDVEEPVELGMDLDLAVVSMEAVDSDGALERVGGMPPLQIAEEFGTRSHFRLGMLSIAYNFGYRGWWFAVRVGELVSDEARARGLDAHISWVVDAVMAGGLPPAASSSASGGVPPAEGVSASAAGSSASRGLPPVASSSAAGLPQVASSSASGGLPPSHIYGVSDPEL